jgi:hypothetical protein
LGDHVICGTPPAISIAAVNLAVAFVGLIPAM